MILLVQWPKRPKRHARLKKPKNIRNFNTIPPPQLALENAILLGDFFFEESFGSMTQKTQKT